MKIEGKMLYGNKYQIIEDNKLKFKYPNKKLNYKLIYNSKEYLLKKDNDNLLWELPLNIEKEISIKIKAIDENKDVLFVTNSIDINLISENSSFAPSISLMNYDESYKKYDIISQYPLIEISERKISVPTNYKIVVEQDTNSQILLFQIDRFFNGIDLSEKAIGINYITSNKIEGKAIAINVNIDDITNKITFGWLLDNNVSQAKGIVKFLIEFLGKTEFGELYRFQSLPASFVVEEGLFIDDSIVEEQYSTIIEDIKLELKRLETMIQAGSIGGGGTDLIIDNNTLKFVGGILSVNTTNDALKDNTQPITSAGVNTIVGNINALLELI